MQLTRFFYFKLKMFKKIFRQIRQKKFFSNRLVNFLIGVNNVD